MGKTAQCREVSPDSGGRKGRGRCSGLELSELEAHPRGWGLGQMLLGAQPFIPLMLWKNNAEQVRQCQTAETFLPLPPITG